MSCNSHFARVFLNQDVRVSSTQPQPIDDNADVRAAPWDDSLPRAVQVVSRHRAIDLMPLLYRTRQERRRNPLFSTRVTMLKSCAASSNRSAASETHSLCGCVSREPWQVFCEIAPHVELGR